MNIANPTVELRGTTYRLAVLHEDELAPVLPLFGDAFQGRAFSLDKVRRKYACNYNDVAGFVCVAFDEGGDAAGCVGLLPWSLQYGEIVEGTGQLVDVATHSAHRGRGLFVQLAEVVRDLCDIAGLGSLFGFPNDEAYPIWTRKLGYQDIGNLVEYRRTVRTLWLERVARRLEALRPLYEWHLERTVSAYGPSDPVLENSLSGEGFACIARDTEFHAYKSRFAGSRVLAVDGGRAWISVAHGLLIGDLEALAEADLDRTTRSIERLARRLGVHQILFQASKDTRFTPFFENRFQSSQGLPIIYRSLGSQIPVDRLRFSFGDLDNF